MKARKVAKNIFPPLLAKDEKLTLSHLLQIANIKNILLIIFKKSTK